MSLRDEDPLRYHQDRERRLLGEDLKSQKVLELKVITGKHKARIAV